MQINKTLKSPNSFIVSEYKPGLCIDFSEPPESTDLDKVREKVQLDQWSSESADAIADKVDELLLELGVSNHKQDFHRSLQQFTNESSISAALPATLRKLGLKSSGDALADAKTLLDFSGVTQRAPHFKVRLYCHIPGQPTVLEGEHTHFGYCISGEENFAKFPDGRTYPIYKNSYFSIAEECEIHGDGKIEVISRFGYKGQTMFGANVESWGRLNYIDGCTDTLLVPPVKLGDACYNALYFPQNTDQTFHTHPSLRAGMVIAGKGICRTPTGDHDLVPGKIFLLPPETWHAFATNNDPVETESALTVIAFHPDSDFGATDDNHPMLNRTYVEFFHRLNSIYRSDNGTGDTVEASAPRATTSMEAPTPAPAG